MDLTGEYRIAAPREAVWRGLNDPDVLARAIPGCEAIEKLSDTEFTAKVAVKIGPVSARFGGKVTLSELDPPNGYRIAGEGQGGGAGFAKGGATVKLAPDETGQGTILSYTVQASVGGKIAQIGSRLIDGASRKLADEFFGRFAEIVAAEAAAAAPPPAGATPQAAARSLAAASGAAPGSPAKATGLSPVVWIGGLVVIVLALLLLFGR